VRTPSDRRERHDRHAGIHHHTSSPVRDLQRAIIPMAFLAILLEAIGRRKTVDSGVDQPESGHRYAGVDACECTVPMVMP